KLLTFFMSVPDMHLAKTRKSFRPENQINAKHKASQRNASEKQQYCLIQPVFLPVLTVGVFVCKIYSTFFIFYLKNLIIGISILFHFLCMDHKVGTILCLVNKSFKILYRFLGIQDHESTRVIRMQIEIGVFFVSVKVDSLDFTRITPGGQIRSWKKHSCCYYRKHYKCKS